MQLLCVFVLVLQAIINACSLMPSFVCGLFCVSHQVVYCSSDNVMDLILALLLAS